MPPASKIGRAHAKAILVGDLAVTAGHPAVVAPLNLETRAYFSSDQDARFGYPYQFSFMPYKEPMTVATAAHRYLENTDWSLPIEAALSRLLILRRRSSTVLRSQRISIESEIPPYNGMGSSSAVAAAVIRLLSLTCGNIAEEDQVRAVWESDRVCHGPMASGIDAHAVCSGSILSYDRLLGIRHVVDANVCFVVGHHSESGRARDQTSVAASQIRLLGIAAQRLSRECMVALGRNDLHGLGQVIDEYGRAMLDTLPILPQVGRTMRRLQQECGSYCKPLGTGGRMGLLLFNPAGYAASKAVLIAEGFSLMHVGTKLRNGS